MKSQQQIFSFYLLALRVASISWRTSNWENPINSSAIIFFLLFSLHSFSSSLLMLMHFMTLVVAHNCFAPTFLLLQKVSFYAQSLWWAFFYVTSVTDDCLNHVQMAAISWVKQVLQFTNFSSRKFNFYVIKNSPLTFSWYIYFFSNDYDEEWENPFWLSGRCHHRSVSDCKWWKWLIKLLCGMRHDERKWKEMDLVVRELNLAEFPHWNFLLLVMFTTFSISRVLQVIKDVELRTRWYMNVWMWNWVTVVDTSTGCCWMKINLKAIGFKFQMINFHL